MERTILVVEDDFDTRYPLAELLAIKGYRVITASDAESALRAARSARPDLILTDIVLPGRSGLHFIRKVRADEAIHATPIIVISGCDQTTRIRAQSAGADCFLEKPIQLEKLWDEFARLLEEKRIARVKYKENSFDHRAAEIESLLEEYRRCSSTAEREALLAQLKEKLLNRTRATNSA
jgi:DNA-binding response OmpR family regulator